MCLVLSLTKRKKFKLIEQQVQSVEVPDNLSSITSERRTRGQASSLLASGAQTLSAPRLQSLEQAIELREVEKVHQLYFSCETADELAAKLKELGFKGERSAIDRCPIANMVRTLTGQSVEMDEERIAVQQRSGDGWWVNNHTPAMTDFIHKFDAGEYPELVGY